MPNFDLHLHTNQSDGSDSPRELIKKIIENSIKIFAVSDHDTISGCQEILSMHLENLTFIPAIELTSKIKNIKCHILGYNINPKDNGLNALIEKGKKLRKIKLETRIEYLRNKWGIVLNDNELNWLYSRQSVVKTHIANILVNRGLSDNNIDAMKKYLDGCKSGDTRFDGYEAISTIINAGGIPVWAHPLGGEGEKHISESEFIKKLDTMINAGIQGLECYYSRYSMEEIEILKNHANKHNLLISGGSDYHGSNKTVLLGQLNINNINIDSKEITLLNNIN